MTVLEVDLSFLFVIAVILIWFMIAYQFVLTVYGFINYVRSMKERNEVDGRTFDFPTCAILIPAHNEEKVIGATIASMLAMNYPKDKLRIVVINDGSTDSTKEIIEGYAKRDTRVELFDIPKGEGGKGKSRALNLGVKRATSDVIAIYDADNTPDPNSLRYLVAQLLLHEELGGVIGKFRTVNKNHNLLTKFINVETLSFQSMLQAGRWQMHSIATLPGTNFVMWTSLIRQLDGWDEEALTEDSELSIRIYEAGYKIKYIPYAITYEQEPQEWKVWIKQRMRWVRGNNYVVSKFLKQSPISKINGLRSTFCTLSHSIIYFSQQSLSPTSSFILSGLNLVAISLPGPYTVVWIMAFFLFLIEIMLAISYDNEDSIGKIALLVLMYFTYCQLWIYIVLKAAYTEYFNKDKRFWEKTVRFDLRRPT